MKDVNAVCDLKTVAKTVNKKLASIFEAEGLKAELEGDHERAEMNKKRARSLIYKVFEFVYKGHHYTFQHSARDQSACPHCGFTRGYTWNPIKDNDSFIGEYQEGEGSIFCFECPKCFGKFYYHKDCEYDIKKRVQL